MTRISAWAFGAALIALPGAALAQQNEHRDDRGGGNGAPHQQAPRPEPVAPPAPRPAPAAGQERGGNWRAQSWAGMHGSPGNPAGNGWQGRPPQSNFTPPQGRPAFQGQPAYQGRPGDQRQPGYQGRPGDQGQPRGDGGWRGDGGGRNDGGRNDGGQWRNDGNSGRRDGGQWRRDGGVARNDGGQWNHGWRQDNRYDWRGWRDQNRDTFRVGRYYPPYRDYSYNRLSLGFYLQPDFFGSDYWIADPWYYRLPPAYGPYHWVRYYNDVILVNTYTGQVADVIYDFFW